MARLDTLIPARFLSMVSHATILVTVLMDVPGTVHSCLPPDYTADEMARTNQQMTAGIGTAVALLSLELAGFVLGASMFTPVILMTSTLCHGSASVFFMYFLLEGWDCALFWPIFAICSVLPTINELLAVLNVTVLKRGW